ncbi:MAG: right-handed parallel beta-helix repeat-containing protein, partial [Planctomycetota bacterium]
MSWYRSFLIVAVVGLFMSAAQATTIYVDDDNCPGPGDGSELNPYCSIQTAIDIAVDMDEIVVAPGTYFETIDFFGKAIWLHSSDGPEVTIIDGQDEGSVVTCTTGEGPDTVLEGFTITGGRGYCGPRRCWGGGMSNHGSSPTVTHCTFSGNTAGFGGGMYNAGGNPTLTGCMFLDNVAFKLCGDPPLTIPCGSGGGMHNSQSDPTLTECTFHSNAANGGGGGVFNSESNPTVTDCTFIGNSGGWLGGGGMRNWYNSNPTVTDCTFNDNIAQSIGGGMANWNNSPTVTDCKFSGNTASLGGGMYNFDSSLTVTDCKFMDNSAEHDGGGMYNYGGSNPMVTDCRFEGNTAYEGNGGGMLNENSNPTITDSLYCENTPDDIWGDWDGADNTFRMFCPPYAFDRSGDGGTSEVLK